MPLSRSGTRASIYSQTSQPVTDNDIPGAFPHTESSINAPTEQTLSEAVHARRAEFSKPHTIRIKVGTWNVAGKKGTENDIANWFVKGSGVSESMSGLSNTRIPESHKDDTTNSSQNKRKENASDQELRVANQNKETTTPRNDPGELPGGGDIGLYVLGLQEIVDISSAAEALRPYTDPTTANKWKEKLEDALPSGYQLIAQQQLVGLILFIYASPAAAPQVSCVSTTSCGTGLMGYMGNKGAVTTRIVLGETTRLIFVNSHLSSGMGKAELDRRNWDAAQIISRTQYEPIEDSLGYVTKRRERIGDEDFGFWFGDLNYRLESIPGHDVRKILMLHTHNEYDPNQKEAQNDDDEQHSTSSKDSFQREHRRSFSSSNASSIISSPGKSSFDNSISYGGSDRSSLGALDEQLDPTSDPAHLQTTLKSLLPHDELRLQQKERKAFHDGWREGPITFLPTYKYDVGSVGVFDSGDKKRGPSWCDRILYRTRKDKMDFENMILEEQDARQKDADYDSKGMGEAAADESMLYEYDPEADGEELAPVENDFATGDAPVYSRTEEGYKDLIQLEYYLSHQRVLSSDHKPLDAVFRLEYDAVIPELKTKVHQEVARDLDRAENEGRPTVTLIPDSQTNGHGKAEDTIHFGRMRFEEEQIQTITLANVGRVAALFGFLSQTQEKTEKVSHTPEWLEVSVQPVHEGEERGATNIPKTKNDGEWSDDVVEIYSLEPGCTCTVKCAATVRSIPLARNLNEKGVLDNVLILRVKDGRDHFLHVHASWEPTVLGHSITELIRLPEAGIRNFHASISQSNDISGKQTSAVTSSAPKELFRLTQAIENLSERILAEWSMVESDKQDEPPPWTKSAGWPFGGWTLEVEERGEIRRSIFEALDTALPFDQFVSVDLSPLHRLEAFAQSFLLFLDSLTDGIITEDLWTQIASQFFSRDRTKNQPTRDDERASILEILSISPPHNTSFILILSMLGSLVQEVSNISYEDGPKDTPKSTGFFTRRRTMSNDPRTARKIAVQKAYASIFAESLIRVPEQPSSKAKTTSLEQKKELIEIFLDSSTDPG